MSTIFKFLSKNYPCHLPALSKDFPSITDLSLGHLAEIDIKKFTFIFMRESALPNLNRTEDFWKGRSLDQIINIHAERMKKIEVFFFFTATIYFGL